MCSNAESILGLVTEFIWARDGERLVILLGGGTKKRQQQDIRAALAHWQDYKRRKQEK